MNDDSQGRPPITNKCKGRGVHRVAYVLEAKIKR